MEPGFSNAQQLKERIDQGGETAQIDCPRCMGRGWQDITPFAEITAPGKPKRKVLGTKCPPLQDGEKISTTGLMHVTCEQCGGKGYVEAVY